MSAPEGLAYLVESSSKERIERLFRYAFLLKAVPKARRYEAVARLELKTDDVIYESVRRGKGGQPFTLLKGRTLRNDHPDAAKTKGTINGAATKATQHARNKAEDEWHAYYNLFKPRNSANPKSRNYFAPGELWVAGARRPEVDGDDDLLHTLPITAHINPTGIEVSHRVDREIRDAVVIGRMLTKPSVISAAALWGHQFVNGRDPDVVRGRWDLEEQYYAGATFWGDYDLVSHAGKKLDEYNRVLEATMAAVEHVGIQPLEGAAAALAGL